METIHQQSYMELESTCCTQERARKLSSATKALALLLLVTIFSYTSKRCEWFSSFVRFRSMRCTESTIDRMAPTVSLFDALTGTNKVDPSGVHANTSNQPGSVSIPLKPFFAELGAVALLQMIGFPMISKASLLVRRINIMRLSRTLHLPTPLVRQLSRQARILTRISAKVWKTAETIYSKTSLSKLVQRIKKLLKIFSHAHDDEEELLASKP